MQIRAVAKYPLKMLEKTWLGNFAKLVRIAFTPLSETKPDRYVPSFRKPNLLETKAGMKRITMARRFRELKKKVLEYCFCP